MVRVIACPLSRSLQTLIWASGLPSRKLLSVMSRFPQNTMFLLLLVVCNLGLRFGQALKVPIRVKDVLPVVPRQLLSWPVLNNLHSAVDVLPDYVGSVTPNNASIQWKGACFLGNEARLEIIPGDRDVPGLEGGVLHLKVLSLGPLFS